MLAKRSRSPCCGQKQLPLQFLGLHGPLNDEIARFLVPYSFSRTIGSRMISDAAAGTIWNENQEASLQHHSPSKGFDQFCQLRTCVHVAGGPCEAEVVAVGERDAVQALALQG